MWSRFAQFITVLALVVAFATPSSGNALHLCDKDQGSSISALDKKFGSKVATPSEAGQKDSEKKPSSHHGEDCHCPIHRSGCHHGSAYIRGEQASMFAINLGISEFSEARISVKPGPFLEGPFQPPRA